MKRILTDQHLTLVKHPVYSSLQNVESLRAFMECHIFAVWDFMSLLKSLQTKVTCTSIPWKPSPYSAEVVRMVNEIVLGEESDVDQHGNPCSHFDLYIKAMEEVGANTAPIKRFIETGNLNDLPEAVKPFVESNLDIALNGRAEEVAASFFFGREKLLPDLFEKILAVLKSEKLECPTLIYYFERHIEVDGESHGPLAMKCLEEICGDCNAKKLRADYAGIQALRQRERLWDNTHQLIERRKNKLYSIH
ncbi:MAG: DUF3050 domain-containing protein [Halobacteriovoraceae bacterium]|nr:DUF3050 domain-containing protein [Halobacteriovoraceae bacterium]